MGWPRSTAEQDAQRCERHGRPAQTVDVVEQRRLHPRTAPSHQPGNQVEARATADQRGDSERQLLKEAVKKGWDADWQRAIFLMRIPRSAGAVRCTVVLEFDRGEGTAVGRVGLMRLHRDTAGPNSGDVGISLAEGKSLWQTVQQEFAVAQLGQFCEQRRTCQACGAVRRLHDSHCSNLKTIVGAAFHCRDRWKACECGADQSRDVSPLKGYLPESTTGELRWLHASLGAMMPYRQALRVMELLLPTNGRDNHVTLRNHTVAVGASIQSAAPPDRPRNAIEPVGELGIDVGYVRKIKSADKDKGADIGKVSSSIAIVVAAVGAVGKPPRVWASALPRSKRLQVEMTKFLHDSSYGSSSRVRVLTCSQMERKISLALLARFPMTAAGSLTGRTLDA